MSEQFFTDEELSDALEVRAHDALPNAPGGEIAAPGQDQRQQQGPELDARGGGRGAGEGEATMSDLIERCGGGMLRR